jgi:hypothetical protein
LRIFSFVLSTQTTATVSDLELELASHVYPYVLAPDLTPATLDRYAETDRTIRRTLRARAALAQATTPATVDLSRTIADFDAGQGGQRTPRPTPPTRPTPPALAVPARPLTLRF